MNRLRRLFDEQGQSPWLDDIKRSYLRSGDLQRLITSGFRGVTANPTIFQRAIEGSEDYDEQFSTLIRRHISVEDAYWDLVIDDITRALQILRPIYDDSNGSDGFASLELDPCRANDISGSIVTARSLHEQINEPNLLVKIPATAVSIAAIRQLTAEGRNINITLIFSLERYEQVIEAYLAGLETCPGDLSRIHSVASFFVGRVDVEVDRRLGRLGTDEARSLQGRAAMAQAKLVYRMFRKCFSGSRWEHLVERGASVQRPLWASTSTKDPAYPDTLYVDGLIGPDTVNTMPEHLAVAFEDHGTLARTIDRDVDEAADVLQRLDAVGIDMADVVLTLEQQGIALFVNSYNELLASLSTKATRLMSS